MICYQVWETNDLLDNQLHRDPGDGDTGRPGHAPRLGYILTFVTRQLPADLSWIAGYDLDDVMMSWVLTTLLMLFMFCAGLAVVSFPWVFMGNCHCQTS